MATITEQSFPCMDQVPRRYSFHSHKTNVLEEVKVIYGEYKPDLYLNGSEFPPNYTEPSHHEFFLDVQSKNFILVASFLHYSKIRDFCFLELAKKIKVKGKHRFTGVDFELTGRIQHILNKKVKKDDPLNFFFNEIEIEGEVTETNLPQRCYYMRPLYIPVTPPV